MKISIFVTIIAGILYAQCPLLDLPPPGGEKAKEKIETIKMWKMTEALDLSEEQASRLFPAMKQFQNRADSLRNQMMKFVEDLENALQENEDSNKITTIVDKIVSLKNQQSKNEAEFFAKMRSILTPAQQAKYILFERDFRRKMMELIHEYQKGKRKHSDNPWEKP